GDCRGCKRRNLGRGWSVPLGAVSKQARRPRSPKVKEVLCGVPNYPASCWRILLSGTRNVQGGGTKQRKCQLPNALPAVRATGLRKLKLSFAKRKANAPHKALGSPNP